MLKTEHEVLVSGSLTGFTLSPSEDSRYFDAIFFLREQESQKLVKIAIFDRPSFNVELAAGEVLNFCITKSHNQGWESESYHLQCDTSYDLSLYAERIEVTYVD